MTQKMMTISCEKLGTEAQALYKRLLETWSYLIFTSVKKSYNYYLVKKNNHTIQLSLISVIRIGRLRT